MSFLARLLGFGPSPAQPTIHETDEIVSTHLFDDWSVMRESDLFWTFRFDEILDADKLATALSQVIEAGDWRKLGGRFRLKPDGKLEVHIPRPFTPERPAIYFTKEHIDLSMHEHPLASQLPTAGEKAELSGDARALAPLAYGPGAPRCMEDRLRDDVPQLGLHVITFRDGTLVSATWSHVMSDLGGFLAIVKAWVANLHGQPIAEFKSMDDAMKPLYENVATEGHHVVADRLLSGWRKASWIANFLWDQIFTIRTLKSHTLCIPKARIDALLANCRADAADAAAEKGGDPFITEGDIAMALAVRIAAKCLPSYSRRSIAATGAVDCRSRFPGIYDAGAAYVQNMATGLVLLRPSSEILGMSVGALALGMRTELGEQMTEAQVKMTTAAVAQVLRDTKSLPPVGDASSFFTTCSNWSKARLLEAMDFAPAVVAPGRKGTENGREVGRPVYFHSRALVPGSFAVCMLLVHGRDYNGDMWLEGDATVPAWEDLVEYINSQT